MQSTKMHFEKLSLAALDAVIAWVGDEARKCVRYGGSCNHRATATGLRDVNESLLRPVRELVRQLAEQGGSQVVPTAKERAEMPEDEPQPHWPFQWCGACGRFARRVKGKCCACGSAKVEPAKPEGGAS
jgi:hypothetical protein